VACASLSLSSLSLLLPPVSHVLMRRQRYQQWREWGIRLYHNIWAQIRVCVKQWEPCQLLTVQYCPPNRLMHLVEAATPSAAWQRVKAHVSIMGHLGTTQCTGSGSLWRASSYGSHLVQGEDLATLPRWYTPVRLTFIRWDAS
jgi:hypothetical protein